MLIGGNAVAVLKVPVTAFTDGEEVGPTPIFKLALVAEVTETEMFTRILYPVVFCFAVPTVIDVPNAEVAVEEDGGVVAIGVER